MDMKDFGKYFANCRVELQRTIGNDIPKIVANKGLLLFKKNFQTESFFGQKWKDVKRRTNPRRSQMGKASAQRPILTGTGDLGRSLKYEVGQGFVRFYSDLPYSAAHNEGTSTAGRGNHTTIPQRQFLGESDEIDRLVTDTIEQQLDKIFR